MSEDHQKMRNASSETCEENLRNVLAALPKKTRRKSQQNTSFEFVVRNLSALLEARNKGYSYEELTEVIRAETAREITAGTLRKYIERATKQARSLQIDSPQSTEHFPNLLKPELVPKANHIQKRADGQPLPSITPEAEQAHGPRPTLFDPENQAHASEDEFENLS